MPNNVTYVMLYVRDEDGPEQSHLLGELHEVYARPLSVGRDPSCDVILDHPSVPPRAAELSAAPNHRMVQWADAELRELIEGPPVRIGVLHVRLSEVIEPRRVALPSAGISVRFGPRNLGAVQAADLPEDPRAAEARRIADGLRDPSGHVRELDDASAAWCEERLRSHVAALSSVTSPRPPLSLGRVEYTGSLGDAVARWDREWSGAEARPFRYSTWSHVQRFGRWMSDLNNERPGDLSYADRYARPVRAHLLDRFQHTLDAVVAAHLAMLDADISPARPLADLLVRGVYPLALPDSAMLLFVASAGETASRSSDPIERHFVDTFADEVARLAYGDYLEQRGELAHADAIRARGGPPLGALVPYAFGDAQALMLLHAREQPTPGDLVPDASVPAARLEIDGHLYALGSRTGLACVDRRLVVDPPPGTWSAMFTQAGGALWLSIARDHVDLRLNHQYLFDRTRQPLFDGDVITLNERSAIVRL